MAGLFDTISLGSRSLNTYQKAIDTTGHNLANVNTPGYTRQRVAIESVTTATSTGSVGAGAEAVRIEQLHDEFLNQQVQVETSVEGSLESRDGALGQALTALQETINRNDGAGTSTSGISQALSDFFASMQSLSTNPSSIPERQVALQKAQSLADRFNLVDNRLAAVQDNLNRSISGQVDQVNALSKDIANLNAAIVSEEAGNTGSANDLRDARQLKLEDLARLVKIDAVEQTDGSMTVSVSGVTLVEGNAVSNTLETFDAGAGDLAVRATGQSDALTITGGAIEGNLSARDNDVLPLRGQINELAEKFIEEVNAVHVGGYGLDGSTGELLFNGTNAADIKVNSVVLGNPARFQASSQSGETGGNATVLALARLGTTAQAALGNQSFSDRQAQIVSGFGQKVSDAQRELDDQKAISGFVKSQRESITGVSLDEEMANLMMFQKAFQASAKLISTTDELLQTIIQM